MAKKYGVSVEDVMKGAGITDPRKLIAGKTITVTNGGGSVSKTKQSKSTVTSTDKSQSSKKNGGSQTPPLPEPPKKPNNNKGRNRKPPSEEEKKILKDGAKAIGGGILKTVEEHNPELVEKGKELLTEVKEVATEAKDVAVETITEISKKIDIQNLKLSDTVKNHMSEIIMRVPNAGRLSRPFIGSEGQGSLVKEIMEASSPVADKFVKSGLRWDVQGTFRGVTGTWELVVDTFTNTIIHFNFVSK